jgi:hypothetical protein
MIAPFSGESPMGSKTLLALALAAVLAVPAAWPVPAAGQTLLSDEGPAVEFRTNVPWARLALDGDQSVSGVAPLSVPGPLEGDFWLSASGPGLELQRGRVHLTLDETGSRITSYGSLPLRQTLLRSLTYPGLAQMRARQRTKGAVLATAATAGVGMALWAHNDFRGARDEGEALRLRLENAVDPAEIDSLEEVVRAAGARERHLQNRRDLFINATGVLWGVSLIDALVFAPRLRVSEADEASLVVGLRRRGRGAALLRSVVFPGLGQEYNGDSGKALWVGIGGVLAGTYYLWRADDYNRADARVDAARARVTMDDTPENRARLDGQLADLDDADREKSLATWVAVGYWGASLLDTLLSFEEPWGTVPVEQASRFGWSADPLAGTAWAEVRF